MKTYKSKRSWSSCAVYDNPEDSVYYLRAVDDEFTIETGQLMEETCVRRNGIVSVKLIPQNVYTSFTELYLTDRSDFDVTETYEASDRTSTIASKYKF